MISFPVGLGDRGIVELNSCKHRAHEEVKGLSQFKIQSVSLLLGGMRQVHI